MNARIVGLAIVMEPSNGAEREQQGAIFCQEGIHFKLLDWGKEGLRARVNGREVKITIEEEKCDDGI